MDVYDAICVSRGIIMCGGVTIAIVADHHIAVGFAQCLRTSIRFTKVLMI